MPFSSTHIMKQKAVIFLYNLTPIIARQWSEAGIDCHLFDIKSANHQDGNIYYHGGDVRKKRKELGQICRENEVLLIGSFTPCTDMATSGAKHFDTKAKNDSLFWAKSLELALIGLDLAEYFDIPYFIEQPRTVLGTLLDRKPDYKFHPWMFGGYLPEGHQHSLYPEYYPNQDAYPKETWLWCGNGFVFPQSIPVEIATNDNPGWEKLGGKSERTKEIRSCTPEGFSRAVFEANYSKVKAA